LRQVLICFNTLIIPFIGNAGIKIFITSNNVDEKLLVVSIGYSSCHWCHVMEKETFEDPDVALYMNEKFVSIKVDREENPRG
jgi:thioredoxin-related protein